MSGSVKQFVDFSTNTNNDSGENNATSIQPMVDGEAATGAVLARPSESLRQRTETVRNVMADTLYLRDADRSLVVTGPRPTVTWPGSTTASASGIPVLGNSLWIMPFLTPGVASNTPPVGSVFGVLHLERASDNLNSISVTSRRRSYSAGDQINVTVTSGASFSCVLDVENGLRRTIKIVATGAVTLGSVISALNALTPPAPDNTQLVTAALENGALTSDLLLVPQTRQYVSGNYDGETHQISVATLSGFFSSNPTQALAEGDTLCVRYDMVSDPASTGGRRQSIPENANVSVPSGSLFNSRVHPEFLANAIPICKVVNNDLVFLGGRTIRAGAVSTALDGNDATGLLYGGGSAWADGTTNPATTVEAQLDKIISDLSGTGGTAKIGGATVGSDLAANPLAVQVSNLATGWLKLDRDNTVSGAQTFQKNTIVGGSLTVGNQLLAFADFTFTADHTTSQFTHAAHSLETGDGPVRLSNTGGALPSGLVPGVDVYAIKVDANTFKIAASRDCALEGLQIDFLDNGTGTQTLQHQSGTTRVTDVTASRVLSVGGATTLHDVTVGGEAFTLPSTVFVANATFDTMAIDNHPLRTGSGPLHVTNSGGALPSPLLAATDYYAIRSNSEKFQLAISRASALAGTAIDLTTSGTGTNTIASSTGAAHTSTATVHGSVTIDGTLTASGTVSAPTVNSSHYNLPSTTFTIPAAAFKATVGAPTLDGGSGSGLWTFQSGSNNTIQCDLQLPVGTRITALKFHVNRASSSSGSIGCSLNSKILGGGNFDFGTPSSTYSDSISSGSAYVTRDLIAIAGSPFTTVSGSAYTLEIDTNLNFAGAAPEFDGVEVTIDRS